MATTPVRPSGGAAEVPARLRLLGTNLLEPGQSGFVQLRTEEPVVAEPVPPEEIPEETPYFLNPEILGREEALAADLLGEE